MWLIITLIIVGILLLVAELVLLPGISVAGIGAFLSLAVAAVYGFFLYGILGGSVVLAAIIIVAVAAVVPIRGSGWRSSRRSMRRPPLLQSRTTFGSASAGRL